MKFIPYGRQDISDEDINAVVDVLKSDFLTQGPCVPQFEQAIADYVGVKHAVAVSSATSALHVACLALGLKKGDWLWTSPNTFVASANCALYCGANVSFVDIDPQTYNMSVSALKAKLATAKANGVLPKVVVPVAFAGQSCEMEEIHQLSKEYGFAIIEDASHAIGGSYQGVKIGNSRFADITILSFHPVKIITTAEGGMALTNCDSLAEKLQLFRSHGITRDGDKMTKATEGGWYYQQVDLGLNYRMTELQAALGVSQLKRIEDFVARRHELARRYDAAFEGVPVSTPLQSPSGYSALHLYPLTVNDPAQRKPLFDYLRDKGIGVNVHYIPVHTQPYYEQLGHKAGDYPIAENYYSRAISIPMYSTLSDEEQNYVIKCIREFF
ncbi:UDP-4-amino-4,6-dideoxy-N-acetyl-beta-L-altrosamine transaminase [Citrobacter koseri]|uniref:UDP-4-amino-4, 6-dideoxy-N-acetyl-beta-L-altrosamine transaminase n=1 Tax=Citrobacter koseri TaxID=545 RepID=UPI001D9A500E|nr:UDP-4-amino-4,6-dideoxy-N-acetyl-beta-L-altrosamine transaminase [Citrobacter koseri]CAG0239943.1 UDP-4-amino-4%2C6-dideoxy-N-acetyl-beta-L-altrosamine transaminase [Citrobacter koseri]CAH6023775.1 UDP-4-amino-4%2C6-dideoxy-N-acetyl-beta-L-altrosamine transaminase [Citrobacter koseri]